MGDNITSDLRVPFTMAKGPSFGSRGGGAVLEKSKVSFKQEAKVFQPRIDDNGGGGNNGGKIFNGGEGQGRWDKGGQRRSPTWTGPDPAHVAGAPGRAGLLLHFGSLLLPSMRLMLARWAVRGPRAWLLTRTPRSLPCSAAGGGGDDGGDDDDYFDFNEGDGEGGDGDGWLRQIFPENYSRIAIQAILDEWFRTVAGLPLWLRGMVEMGLFSSQQLARFFTMDARPNLVRCAPRCS